MKIIKTYREEIPGVVLIGRRYTEADRQGGSFGQKWGACFGDGTFETLEKLGGQEPGTACDGSYFGWMKCCTDLEYWIGMLFPSGTEVPEGFASMAIPAGAYGICWLYGKEDTGELYGMDAHTRAANAIEQSGLKTKDGILFSFERYNCPRFTTPDEQGNVILDYGIQLAE